MRRETVGPDGLVNPRKLDGWMKRHQDVLRAIDERDGGAFSQTIRQAGQAQETLAAAAARREAVTEQYSKNELGRLIGATDETHIQNILGSIFGRVDSVARARELASKLTTPAAREGAQRAIRDFIRNRFVSNAEVAGNPLLRAEQFQNFMRANAAALRQFMTPEQVNNLTAIATDLRRAARSVQTKIPGGSDTFQNIIEAQKQGWPGRTFLTKLAIDYTIGRIPFVGPIVRMGTEALLQHYKANGINNVQQLIDRAMLDPEFAKELLQKSAIRKTRAVPAITPTMGAVGYEAGAVGAEPWWKKKPVPRPTGRNVQPTGRARGGPAGKTAAAGARALRAGPRQALQDGGTARNQEAGQVKPGTHEHMAALFGGSPASRGKNIVGSLGESKAKLKPLSRYDVAQQLKAVNLPVEPWLGEGDKDKLQAGGEVEPADEPPPNARIGLPTVPPPIVPPRPDTGAKTIPRFIAEEAIPHLISAPFQLAAGPGRAYRGEMSPEEQTEWGPAMATAMAGRMPLREQGFGVFGGTGARTANRAMLAKAQEMHAAGAPAESIWNQTGWARGPEGKWRFEIPDEASYLYPTERIQASTGSEAASRPSGLRVGSLEETISHPEFFKAYPQFKQMPATVEMGVGTPESGYFIQPKDLGLLDRSRGGQGVGRVASTGPDFDTARSSLLHEMQHAVQETEGFAPGASPKALPMTNRQISNIARRRAETADVDWNQLSPADRKTLERAVRYEMYRMYAGETEARNVQTRRDFGPPERQRPPWKTEDVPRDIQLVPTEEAAAGRPPPRGKKPFKKAEKLQQGGPVDDEAAQAQEARERAALTMRRGVLGAERFTEGSGRQEGPLTSFVEHGYGVPAAVRALNEGARQAIESAGNLQRTGEYDAGPVVREVAGAIGAPGLGPAVRGGTALGAGVVRRVGLRAPSGGAEYPGIYRRPDVIAAEAAGMVAPEHPALKQLFGVTRQDLYDISQQGRRAGNILEPIYGGRAANPKGSYVAEGVMTPSNERRILNAMTEAQRYPQLVRGMDAWYVMDPAYQRMVQLVGPEQARRNYIRFNTLGSMASPGSDVLTEINRGTAANMMAARGEFPLFHRYAGLAEAKRGADFPPALRAVQGHPYHSTSQAEPMRQYLESGAVEMTSPKVPLYIQASGVPEVGFQTRLPVPDAHFARALGVSDVRAAHGHLKPGVSMKTPEYAPIGPWFRERIARPLGVEAVPAQARMWGLFSPQTGVDTPIGAPKLELLAQRIWERAHQLGVDPRLLRDQVLQGQQHAVYAAPIPGLGREQARAER
jgi:hypothetical protein